MVDRIVLAYASLVACVGLAGGSCVGAVDDNSGVNDAGAGGSSSGSGGTGGQGGGGSGGQGGAGRDGSSGPGGGGRSGNGGQGGAGQGGSSGRGGAGQDGARPDTPGADGAGTGGTSSGRDGGGADTDAADGADVDARDAGSIADAGTKDTGGNDVAPPGRFRHPGVLVNQLQLDFVRDKVKAGAEPWKAGYEKAKASSYASLSWTPKARDIVECGSSSNPNFGCSDERDDALAAYTHALLWHMSGDPAHAQKAVEILNAWGNLLKSHINTNAPLQAGWSGATFARAAEIIRYTSNEWTKTDIDRFSAMLNGAFVPLVNVNSSKNGNWELIMTDASIGIGVFNDDSAVFDKAVSMWRKRVPAYIYLTTDGPYPVPPPVGGQNTPAELIAFWQGQSTFVVSAARRGVLFTARLKRNAWRHDGDGSEVGGARFGVA